MKFVKLTSIFFKANKFIVLYTVQTSKKSITLSEIVNCTLNVRKRFLGVDIKISIIAGERMLCYLHTFKMLKINAICYLYSPSDY